MQKRALDSRCRSLHEEAVLTSGHADLLDFTISSFSTRTFSMSRPLKLSMHSTQTLPCGRLPSVMGNSRVGQRQGVVHQQNSI